jgi:hypothetical protein
MGNINMIKDGSGIEFTAFINGWKEHFKLCIIRRKDWDRQEFAFINDDKTKVIDSVYSGGSTGFGTDDRSIKDPTTWELVTDDLDEIMNIAEKKDIAEKKEREEFLNKQQTRTDMINALPKLIPTGIEFLDKKYAFERSDADFNPVYSPSVIKGGTIRLKDITANEDCHNVYIYLDQFLTRDGRRNSVLHRNRKMMVKQFAKSFICNDLLKEFPEAFKMDPKELLMQLVNKQTELENEIRKIKKS